MRPGFLTANLWNGLYNISKKKKKNPPGKFSKCDIY